MSGNISNHKFFEQITGFSNPVGVSDISNYHDVPSDWVIFLSDVVGSTQAIADGRYKDVNLVGVSCISAVRNACQGVAFPFVFGGDGATFVVPADLAPAVRQALVGTRHMAKAEFSLDLRIAQVPLRDLAAAKQGLKVGKYQVSKDLALAVFAGRALGAAEVLAKNPASGATYLVNDEMTKAVDFSGLECRWEPIQNEKGEILSILIKAREPTGIVGNAGDFDEQKIYREVIEEIELILGQSKEAMLPVRKSNLKTITKPWQLMGEQKIRSFGQGPFAKIKYFLNLLLAVSCGWFFFKFKMKFNGVDWGKYQDEVIANSDFWKYDEMLRFVVDVSPAQKRALLACFDTRKARGEMFYGIHSSKSALMTCLVSNREGNHVHFIDGGDGGYAIAAKQLKTQVKGL